MGSVAGVEKLPATVTEIKTNSFDGISDSPNVTVRWLK